MYQVKWEGYEKKSDMTWEPEENLLYVYHLSLVTWMLTKCEFARGSAEEILNKYLKSVGGREAILGGEDAKKKELKGKKRARAPTATSTPDSKPNSKKPRKNAPHPASTTPPASLKNAEFVPPTGSWEDAVQGIDACEGTDGNVMVFLQWASGHKTQHPLEQVYKRCPQKVCITFESHHNTALLMRVQMLKFYESHLSFTPATRASETSTDVVIASSKEGTGRPRGLPPKPKV
jgi:chromobox protein 1